MFCEGLAANNAKQYSCFRSNRLYRRVKARPADRNLGRERSPAGLHASRDSLYRTARGERQHRPGVDPIGSPAAAMSVLRKPHDHRPWTAAPPSPDDRHERIWVRRGICEPCGKTFTFLPDWLAPVAPFSLRCRQQACERIAAGDSAEQAAPHCQDPARLPDPSTVRRWARRRLLSLWCWTKARANGQHFLLTPTILAWDLAAFCRTLLLEAKSP
jgi:hypothetical protein